MADDRGDLRRFFGNLLVALGGLMATLCGSCGAFFVVAGVATLKDPEGFGQMMLWSGLILGGIPALVGLGMLAWGRRLRRSGDRPSLPQANFDSLD